MFAPASIHPDCFALSANFSLKILMYFDSPSNIFGSVRMALKFDWWVVIDENYIIVKEFLIISKTWSSYLLLKNGSN